MHGTSSNDNGPAHPTCYWGFGPRTSSILATSALASTSYALGAFWLGYMTMGLPVGAWIVGAVGLGTHIAFGGRVPTLNGLRSIKDLAGQTPRVFAKHTRYSIDPEHPESIHEQESGPLVYRIGNSVSKVRREIERVSRAMSTRADLIRIGVDLPQNEFESLGHAWNEASVGPASVEWSLAETGLADNGAMDSRGYDALLRRDAGGQLHLFVPVEDQSPSAWSDWSQPSALGYATVFPVRLDCEHVVLGACDLAESDVCDLVCAVAVSAAALGRTEARHTHAGRLSGRLNLDNEPKVIQAAIGKVADALLSLDADSDAYNAPVCAAAARLLLARVATRNDSLGHENRLDLARTALGVVASEPESALRFAAVQLGMGQTDEGISTLLDAFKVLRKSGQTCMADPLAFVMSEAEMGSDDPLTLGRIAAGVTLTFATAREETLGYLKDDLMDDLEASAHFSENPEGVALVKTLLERLVHASEPAQKTTRRRRKAA